MSDPNDVAMAGGRDDYAVFARTLRDQDGVAWKAPALEVVLAEGPDTAVALFDADLRFLAQNARSAGYFNGSEATTFDALFGAEAPAARAIATRLLRAGEAARDFGVVSVGGERLRARFRSLHGADGDVVGLAVLARPLGGEPSTRAEAVDARLRAVMDALPTMTFLLDEEGVLREANAAALTVSNLSPSDVLGRPLQETYWWSGEAETRERLTDALGRAQSGERVQYQDRMRISGDGFRTVMLHVARIAGGESETDRIVVSAADVSPLIELQERQALLAGELTHRAKNMLAIVKSLVTRAARRARSKDALARSLEGRIGAMAAAISQVSRTQWSDHDLKEIICDQLEPYDRQRITIEGPSVPVPAKAAMAFALIVYELASNALKYGGLQGANGQVVIAWRVEGQALRFSWRERCEHAIARPGEAGFGSTLIANLVQGDLGATLHTDFTDRGVEVSFDAPLAHLGKEAGPLADMAADTASHARLRGKRVLILEGSPVTALDLANMIEAAGASVTGPFASVDEARAALQSERFDIAFVDVETQKADALVLAKAAHKRGTALVLAAMEDSVVAVQAMLPSAAMLRKPFSESDALRAFLTAA